MDLWMEMQVGKRFAHFLSYALDADLLARDVSLDAERWSRDEWNW